MPLNLWFAFFIFAAEEGNTVAETSETIRILASVNFSIPLLLNFFYFFSMCATSFVIFLTTNPYINWKTA